MTQPVEDTGARCLECDYNLTGLTGEHCPECGWTIDPSLVELSREQPPAVVERMMLATLCAVVGGAAVYFVLAGQVRWFSVGVPPGPARGGLGAAALGVFTVACGVCHLGLLCVLRFARSWPVVNPTAARVCQVAAALQVIAAACFTFGSFGSRPFSVVGFAVVFAVLSAVGWVLLFATSIAFGSRRDVVRHLRARSAAQEQADAEGAGAPFVIDVMGRFTRADVVVTWSAVARRTDATIESAIDATWRERVADAGRRNLYNGSLGRLIEASVLDGGKLALTIGATNYRDFLGTNLYNGHLHATFGDACFSNALGTSATVITRDGYLLFGRRNDRVMIHGGCLHTFGGTLEDEDRRISPSPATGQTGTDGYDVFGAIRRELWEELRLADAEIDALVCTGLVRDRRIVQPELLFDAHVHLSREELLSRFDAASDEEHSALESCYDDPERIVPFIERSAPVVPVAMAGMLLHGRGSFGVEWYENACYVLFGALPSRGA